MIFSRQRFQMHFGASGAAHGIYLEIFVNTIATGDLTAWCGLFRRNRSLGKNLNTLWRHQMETFSAALAIYEGNPPVTGGFPSQRPMTGNFDVFFDLYLNKRLNEQSILRWFEMPSRSLWRHCYILHHLRLLGWQKRQIYISCFLKGFQHINV